MLTLVVLPLVYILKVIDTRVVVVLSGEDDIVQVVGMGIRDGVSYVVKVRQIASFKACVTGLGLTVRIPSAETYLVTVIV